MSYFPLCIDVTNAPVLLVGDGPQMQEKIAKLRPFQAKLHRLNTLTSDDLECEPRMVIIGDLEFSQAARYSALCRQKHIPVNVVDMPSLCTFYFPALVQRGDLTVGISTGGKSPGLAACLRKKIDALLPYRTGEILDWLFQLRPKLKKRLSRVEFRNTLRKATQQSLSLGRPLSAQEMEQLIKMEQGEVAVNENCGNL